jgi:hypothetical protein
VHIQNVQRQAQTMLPAMACCTLFIQ